MKELVPELQLRFNNKEPYEVLSYFLNTYQDKIALASSMGAEDQVLTDLVLKMNPKSRIFTIDTGRLHQETYALITKTMQYYQMNFEIYCPQTSALEEMESKFGPDLFYQSIESRKRCCQNRKVEPLQRALKDLSVWITGLRREQGVTRTNIDIVEWDHSNHLIKINPLAQWTTAEIWQTIYKSNIPYNPLHDKGFPSIGCAPCTRAVQFGEGQRAGRWWWEEPEHKECGLHFRQRNNKWGKPT